MLRQKGLDTTTLCASTLVQGLQGHIAAMKDLVTEAQSKIYNPIDLFTKHYNDENKSLLEKCKDYRIKLDDARRTAEKARVKYYQDSEDKEFSEKELMEKIKEHESGQITFEQF